MQPCLPLRRKLVPKKEKILAKEQLLKLKNRAAIVLFIYIDHN